MQTRPPDVTDAQIATALSEGWGLSNPSVAYLPVGYGSHHWSVGDDAGARWFVSLDVLDPQRPGRTFTRIAGALHAAAAARVHGLPFVVAPHRALDGWLLRRAVRGCAIALYPHVVGRSGGFGDAVDPGTVTEIVGMLRALHAVPREPMDGAGPEVESPVVPGRRHIDEALADLPGRSWTGPYGARLRSALGRHAAAVRAALADHDRLVAEAWPSASALVLTHGEPHPGNLIATEHGLVLVDWETALLAPPERDLWLLDERTAGGAAEEYAGAAGRALDGRLLARYRIAWALADIAVYLELLRWAPEETEDTAWSWQALSATLEDLGQPVSPAPGRESSAHTSLP